MHTTRSLITTLFFCLVLSGCSSQAPTVRTERYFWPPLPDNPRIEWIKSYSSQLDIERSQYQLLMEKLIGSDNPLFLMKPVDVKSDPAHKRVFVSDIGAGTVYVFDEQQHELRQLRTEGFEPAVQITSPLSIGIHSNGDIYVLDRRASALIVFTPDEKAKQVIPLDSIMQRPISFTIDSRRQRLLVSDGSQHRIHILDMKGKPIASFGKPGDKDGEFNLPVSTAVTAQGDIVVADAFNARIQIFDPSGTHIRTFGSRGTGDGSFQLIKSVAVDSEDHIYVVDGRQHRVSIFDRTGQLLLIFGDFYAVSQSGKRAPGGFSVPVAIDIDSTDRIYIVDQLNARVQVFQYLSASYTSRFPVPSSRTAP